MKHARHDYDRIQDPAGKIPADEPVFLLRGQDLAAPSTLRFWAERNRDLGGDEELSALTESQAVEMEKWQAVVRGKAADPEPAQPRLGCGLTLTYDPDNDQRLTARRLYDAYNAGGDPATANKNFRGDPCPTWDDLPKNVRDKWEAAAALAHAMRDKR